MKITVWEHKSKDEWKHNHISDGWEHGDRPTPKSALFTQQIGSWKNGQWRKYFTYLDERRVMTTIRRFVW